VRVGLGEFLISRGTARADPTPLKQVVAFDPIDGSGDDFTLFFAFT
jgi:hypothetical protein